MAKLVTVATDGFRDYVSLPGGRQINLGSISVLKLVTSLVRGVNPCRRALNAFLKNRQVVISVDLEELEDLLKPKRSRWACHDDLFIPNGFRQLVRGTSMNPETSQAEALTQKIAAIEEALGSLDKAAAEHGVGSELTLVWTDTLSGLVSKLGSDSTEKTAAVDKAIMEELSVYMDNEDSLANQKESIIKNIMRKKKRGVYDPSLAPKLWLYWVDSGAEAYVKRFGIKTPGKKYFPIELRRALAAELAKSEEKMIEDGEYSSIKIAGDEQEKDQVDQAQEKEAGEKDQVDQIQEKEAGEKDKDDGEDKKKSLPPWLEKKEASATPVYYKLAAADVPVINEALAHSVMAKIDLALGVVDTSTKKNVHLAKSDLTKITSQLSTLITGADLGDPTLCTPLKELAVMADKIHTHFS
jgi:hypothetical protein